MAAPHRVNGVQPAKPTLLVILSVCLVAALFLGYEAVGRAWLQAAQPEMLRTLRLLRGLSATAIVATLGVAILILRQIHGYAGTNLKRAAMPGTWKRSLQHVSLRTKIVVPMVALAAIPAMAIGGLNISQAREALRNSTTQRMAFEAATKATVLQQFLNLVWQDLHTLGRLEAIRWLADAERTGPPQQVAALRQAAEDQLVLFSQGLRLYYQLRYLNSAGHEMVRLNVEGDRVWAVAAEDLQDKSERYYVKEALRLGAEQIYVSPMDLNVEHEKVEIPHRPVVRYATHVYGFSGGDGLLVVNLDADYLFSLLRAPTGEDVWLVDEGGAYLGYVGAAEDKRDLYRFDRRRSLSADYRAEEVSAILENQTESQTVETSRVFLAAAPISLEKEGTGQRWKLLTSYSRAPLDAAIRRLTLALSFVVTQFVAIAGLLGVLIANYVTRPVAVLRQATREVAGGDLFKRVEVYTADEVEDLAVDFNTMTEQLHDAQQRLAGWNIELEREVARQTDQLRQLQTGLARADKLASIGQMTAGIMHEIGNPLAAIKTKIQVAEEDGHLRGDCQALLSGVLAEVDRLANFLRSFSRLSRLREPDVTDISLDEVVRGVSALIAPELDQRGIWLRVESARHAPTIRGDADQLRQLLINLILNAAEASPTGGDVRIRVQSGVAPGTVPPSPGTATIEIVDRGKGIPADIIDKVWDPFFTTKPTGTGLGLAICRQIVEDHRGTIRLRSQPGEGTSVILTFPTGDADPGERTRKESTRQGL